MFPKQAKLINMFAEKEIWNNVIIICKQSMNPEFDSQGALNAGYAFNSLSKMQIAGFRYVEDSSLKPKQQMALASDPEMRLNMNILTDTEVKQEILGKIGNIQNDVQIICSKIFIWA